MTTNRIKEIQDKTAYPNSVSVQQALLQVWNECEQDNADKKYTEEDVIHLMFNASNWDTFKEGEVGYDMSLSEYIQHCLQTLNKQD